VEDEDDVVEAVDISTVPEHAVRTREARSGAKQAARISRR
jgi:hypothetical protein